MDISSKLGLVRHEFEQKPTHPMQPCDQNQTILIQNMTPPRIVVFPVDNSDESERSWQWMLNNFLKDDDEVIDISFTWR